MFSTEKLKNEIVARGGHARANRFKVLLPVIGNHSTENLAVFCKSVNLPGQQVLTHDRRIASSFQKVAYGYGSDDVSMTFLLTSDYFIKDYFTEWQNLSIIRNEETDFHYPQYKTEYAKDVKIQQLDMNGRNIYQCTLVGAFPTTVEALQLGDANESSTIELNIQLSYTRWYDSHFLKPEATPSGTS